MFTLLAAGCFNPSAVLAQIDPVPRKLIQLGYNAAFQGHAPISAYAFYYWNEPNFLRTNLTLRLAIAPTYVDSELGISHVFSENTDLGIGVAGGGFADSYDEIRGGTFRPKESFVGHGGEASVSLYHCFNPGKQIPLNGVLRGLAHYTTYESDDGTANNFILPNDHTWFGVRTGLRFGGKEPVLFPSLAMELSVWYEGQYRMEADRYGLTDLDHPRGDRSMREMSHLFWGQALLAYSFTNTGQSFYINLTAGSSVDADRFSAYRLGALLPLVAEFPLSLPGYYYQEISAKQFIMLGGNYTIALDKKARWNANIVAATAGVEYLPGLQQAGAWHSGVGGGILYQLPSFKMMVGYAYGIDAIRSGGRGAHSIGFLMQVDLEHAKQLLYNTQQPSRWRGFQRMFGAIGD
ncbi:MAG: hypothetical protein H7Y43_16660 [Akkermansiaceae bacterium]|nr:hypothetical protein [Verrucomicrobiales bacterium]